MSPTVDRVRLADGTSVAYAVSGSGPVLVAVPGWLSDLELSWAIPEERGLHEGLSAGRTLVRYDRPGCGLSGETTDPDVVAVELQVLDAVVARVADGPVEVFGTSFGAPLSVLWAATRPDAVSRLVLYGGWAEGAAVAPPGVRRHVLGLVEEHWGLGSDLLTDIFAPDASAGQRATIATYQRRAGTAQTARRMLAAAYEIDVTAQLGQVRAPTAVLHREGDRAAPVSQGRLLARGIPGATFTLLPGRSHLPFVGDVDGVVDGVRAALGLPARRPSVRPQLTPRQLEVAGLVAAGLSNRQIAERLVLTERTAESHVERIRLRLGFRSRAQIAAWYVATTAT